MNKLIHLLKKTRVLLPCLMLVTLVTPVHAFAPSLLLPIVAEWTFGVVRIVPTNGPCYLCRSKQLISFGVFHCVLRKSYKNNARNTIALM